MAKIVSSSRKHGRKGVSSAARACICAAVSIAVLAGAAMLVKPARHAGPERDDAPESIPAVTNAAERASAPVAPERVATPLETAGRADTPGPVTSGKEAENKVELPDYVPADYVPKAGQMILPNGKIMTFPPPTEDKPRKLLAGNRTWECYADGSWRDVTPRQLFKTAFEANFLGLSVEGRSFIPAFLTGLDQDDVVRMLQKEYVPVGDETEDELAQLAAYDEMRAIALDYIGQGGSFDDFVAGIASQVAAERKLHAKSLKQVMTLFKEGRLDEAKARAEELNATLESEGFKPLRLPAHVRAAFGE